MVKLTRKQKQLEKLKDQIERKKKYIQSHKAKIQLSKRRIETIKKEIKTKQKIIKRTEKEEIEELTRVVEFEITFSCCAPNIKPWRVPEPHHMRLTDTGSKIKSLVVWKDFFLDSDYVKDYIESVANSKCRVTLGDSALMCDDGYETEVIDYYEE